MYSKPFRLTRLRLAAWYTSVMTIILILSGIAIDRLLVHARWLHLDGEMQKLSSSLENEIETGLTQPGKIDPRLLHPHKDDELAQLLLFNLCQQTVVCPPELRKNLKQFDPEKTLNDWGNREYCLRFLSSDKTPVVSI